MSPPASRRRGVRSRPSAAMWRARTNTTRARALGEGHLPRPGRALRARRSTSLRGPLRPGRARDPRSPQEVTAQVVDLHARIKNLRASEDALVAIMDRAGRIDDVLSVQLRLEDVRGRIEQLDAQRDDLAGRAALATLTVAWSTPVAAVASRRRAGTRPRGRSRAGADGRRAAGSGQRPVWFARRRTPAHWSSCPSSLLASSRSCCCDAGGRPVAGRPGRRPSSTRPRRRTSFASRLRHHRRHHPGRQPRRPQRCASH